ncbi:MAG: hypothetical protein QOG53_729 [Frankiales bacterium]|nr:hypothetical protein [Frankiales bacterium]
MTSRAGAVLLALLALALTVGCAGSEPVAKEPPPLSSLLPSPPSPTPTSDAAIVQGVIRAYVDAVNVALSTGDISDAEQLTTAKCNCRKRLREIAALYAKKGRTVGARLDVVSIQLGTMTPGAQPATLTYNSPPSTTITGAGATKSYPARSNVKLALVVIKTSGKWLLSSITTPKS